MTRTSETGVTRRAPFEPRPGEERTKVPGLREQRHLFPVRAGTDSPYVSSASAYAAPTVVADAAGLLPAATLDGVPVVELMAEAIPHIAWIATPDGVTAYVNRRGCDYTGWPPEADNVWPWGSLVHPDDAECASRAWEFATRISGEYSLDSRIRRHDGVFRWHAFRALPMRDQQGHVRLWIGTATDIEDRKQLEQSLRDSEQSAQELVGLLQAIEDAAPIGFKLVDRDLRVIRMNNRLARMNGVPAEAQIGRTVAEVVPSLWPSLEGAYRAALQGDVVSNIEVSMPSAEEPDRMRHWLASYYPVSINDEIIGVGNVVVDITELSEAEQALSRSLNAVVDTIARAVEYRDPYTAGHQQRVADIAGVIAAELSLDQSTIQGIKVAARIHDLGKISVPAEILSKPGRLSVPEFDLIKQHAEAGYHIVAAVDFPWPVAEMIRQHHERMDGSGYPRGLKGDEILLGARIIAVADVFEAMTSHRPYRPALGPDEALRHIIEDRGQRLDPRVVDACVRTLRGSDGS